MDGKKGIIRILVGFVLLGLAITSAAAAQDISFGVISGMSGVSAMYGQAAKDGASMAVKEMNGAGGVLGRKVVSIFRDNQSSPEITLRESKSLVFENHVLWLQVGVGTSVVLPAVDFAGEYGKSEKFLMLPSSIGDMMTEDKFNRYTVRLWQNSTPVGRVMSRAVYRAYGDSKYMCVGVDVSTTRLMFDTFKNDMRKINPKIEFLPDLFTPLGATDFTPYISKIMASDAKVVYNQMWGGDYAAWLKQAYAFGFFDKIHEVGTASGQVESVGHLRKGDPWPKGVLSGEYAPIWEVYGTLGKGFNDRFYKEFGYYPGQNAVNNYSWVYIMADLIKDVKSTDVEKLISGFEGRMVEHALGRYKVRAYDHQIMMPFWAGITEFPDTLPHPRVLKVWAPPPEEYESLYRTIPEIKALRQKAGNPYANYLGN